MTRLSIRWRLTLWYAAALGGILTGFCASLLLLTRHQLLARTDAALREELQELALEVRLAKTSQEFEEHLHARFYQHDTYDFLVTDAESSLLFVSSGLTAPQAASLISHDLNVSWEYTTRNLLNERDYRIARSAVDGPRGRVVVQALTPLTPLYHEMQTLQVMMSVLLPLGIATALLGGYFLARRALAPVEQIVQVAAAITISGLDRRIEVSNPHDEIGHLAATLNLLIARLERAVAEIQRFTADASHELRTPLAVLRSEAESALRKTRSPEEYQRTLTVVVEEATRLGSLADQLLNLSRQDAGIVACRQEPVRVDALLLDVVEQLRPLASVRGVALETGDIESCEILGDDLQLGQAFFNVVENAIKYTQPGGSIDLECRVLEGCVEVMVRDTGIGIPVEHLGRVFDRFYRVDSSRQSRTGGAGLGLAISRTAVLAHHGEIQVESEVGIGTTVTIRLPLVSVTSNRQSQASDREATSRTAARSGSCS
jgi:heavy metal sensor kinase